MCNYLECMGRKMLSCNIGDVFGCFEVIELPVVKGEHSYVKVRCTKCQKIQELALSEIKNRPKQNCQYCRGMRHQLYDIPKQGEVFANWEVLGDVKKENRFIYIKCRCLICEHEQYVRKDQLIVTHKKCDNCKYKAAKEKSIRQLKIKERRRNQPFLTVFNHVCAEAAKRSIPVTITPQYIEQIYNQQNKCCAITGDLLPDIRKASVDRIDSSKPYEIDNIQIVTKQANLSKHVMTMEQLYEFCKKVIKHANQKPSTPLTKSEGSETNS